MYHLYINKPTVWGIIECITYINKPTVW